LHAGGGSKVVLAYANDDVRNAVLDGPLERYTNATITDATHLQSLLDTIRTDGYHVAIGDIDEDAFSVAAPIRDHADEVVAALSIAGPTSRLDDEALTLYRQTVLKVSAEISVALRS
jgi:IclR family KDG regulon transcriptional repressor